MNNEYTASKVIEIGEAQEVILGMKPIGVSDDSGLRLESEVIEIGEAQGVILGAKPIGQVDDTSFQSSSENDLDD